MINYSKYSTTNIPNGSSAYISNLNNSMNIIGGHSGANSVKRQSSGTSHNRQEQSVEKLKSCIADLKKVAASTK